MDHLDLAGGQAQRLFHHVQNLHHFFERTVGHFPVLVFDSSRALSDCLFKNFDLLLGEGHVCLTKRVYPGSRRENFSLSSLNLANDSEEAVFPFQSIFDFSVSAIVLL